MDMKWGNKGYNQTDLLSITDVVKTTGIRESRIKYYIARGKLRAVKMGWQWFIHKQDLDEFLKTYNK